MTAGLALACGEVPWERDVIEAAGESDGLHLQRRYVDAASLVADAKAGVLAPMLIMSPALRGFDERALQSLAGAGARPIIVLDGIRPTWLDVSDPRCRELAEVRWPQLLEALLIDAAPAQQVPTSRPVPITVFIGVGGGAGTTSLAWIAALAAPDALLLDAAERPALGFLAGVDAASNTLAGLIDRLRAGERLDPRSVAIDRRVHTLRPGVDEEFTDGDVELLLDAAQPHGVQLVVDAGTWPCRPFAAGLLSRATRVVVVASACPPGILALSRVAPQFSGQTASVVLNRFRDTLARGPRGRMAIADLVERMCGARPHIVEDATAAFDGAWLRGDWAVASRSVPSLA